MFALHLLAERAEDGEELIDGAVDDGIDQKPRAVEAELGARVHDARQQEVVDLRGRPLDRDDDVLVLHQEERHLLSWRGPSHARGE